MENNRLLHLAASLCSILKALAVCLAVVLTAMLVHWHFAPGFYEFIEVPVPESGFSLSLETTTLTIKFSEVAASATVANATTVAPESIKPDAVYLLYLQSAGLTFLWILILREIKRVITSVQGLQTFRDSNSITFRKIGWYCFYLFLLSSFDWLRTDTVFLVAFYLDAIPLFFMLISFILSEIFAEGNRLYEEEQLTI